MARKVLICFFLLFCKFGQSDPFELNYENDLLEGYQIALNRLLQKASTKECQQKIHEAYSQYWNALIFEQPYPFEKQEFFSQCPNQQRGSSLHGLRLTDEPAIKKPTPVKIPRRTEKFLDPSTLGILYVLLIHQSPDFVFRLINSLNESQHTFVLHVDAKSTETANVISTTLSSLNSPHNVFLLPNHLRSTISWGGYSIINATLTALEYGFTLGRSFDYVINLSGSTYPIQTNTYIRQYLSRDPNAIYNSIKPRESKPPPETWHHYVECDNSLHRIARLALPRGISIHVGSQWFAIPKHVAEWILRDPLPTSYQAYATHVVVADEHYFSTMLTHSPYCHDIVSFDVNFLQFAHWEIGNPAKCLQPDPKRCGRSPATLEPLFFPAVMMSDAFFARKFNPLDNESSLLLEKIDIIRQQRAVEERNQRPSSNIRATPLLIMAITDEFNNHPNMVSLKEKYSCLQMPKKSGDEVTLVPCDTTNRLQYFTLGLPSSPPLPSSLVSPLVSSLTSTDEDKCISINANYFNTSKYETCPSEFHPFSSPSKFTYPRVVDTDIVQDDHPDPQIYCRYQSFPDEKNNNSDATKRLCLDVKGQQLSQTSIIGYQCAGSWNQYFRWSRDGRLSATLPYVMGKTRGMNTSDPKNSTICLEVATSKTNSSDTLQTTSCQCFENEFMSSRQIFRLIHPHDLPKDMSIKQGVFVKKNATQQNPSSSKQKFLSSNIHSPRRAPSPAPLVMRNRNSRDHQIATREGAGGGVGEAHDEQRNDKKEMNTRGDDRQHMRPNKIRGGGGEEL